MAMVILDKADFSHALHPFQWYELLEEVLPESELPESRNDYPDSVILHVRKAEVNE